MRTAGILKRGKKAPGTRRLPQGVRRMVGISPRPRAGAADELPWLEHLHDYQKEGVLWLRSKRNALLSDDMGCVSGDSVVNINRCGAGWSLPLSELYRRFNGLQGRWDRSLPTRIRSLRGAELRMNPITAVLDKGVAPVVLVTLASGKTLRATPDHEVCVSVAGEFRRADGLRVGDTVVANGTPACSECRSTEQVVSYPYAKFVGFCRRCVYKRFRVKPTWKGGRIVDCDGYVRVSSQHDHPRRTTGGVYEHILVMEQSIGRYVRVDEIVHHKNGIKTDNRLENLELLTKSEHARHHALESGLGKLDGSRGLFIPKIDSVVSVVPAGMDHVYDVVCADPHRNFVANGIVVHNCGKTVQFLRALPLKARALVCCPASVCLTWKAAIERSEVGPQGQPPGRPDLRATVVKHLRRPDESEVLIISYDSLPDPSPGLEKVVLEPMGDVHLLLDECQALQTEDAKRTLRVRRLKNQCGPVWGASATPMRGTPENLWGVLVSLGLGVETFREMPGPVDEETGKPTVLKGREMFVHLCQGKKRFIRATRCKRHLNNACESSCKGRLKQVGYEWGTISPEVRRMLEAGGGGPMLRRLKEQVLADLPEATYEQIPIEAPEDLREYLAEVTRAWDEVDQEELPPFELLSAALAALARARIPAAIELAEAMTESLGQILVFSAHIEPVMAVAGAVKGAAAYTGEMTQKEKNAVETAFHAGEIRCLALTIAAGGVGLNLQEARGVLVIDRTWTPADNDQAVARAVRQGQKHNVLVKTMVSAHPIEERLLDVLGRKRRHIGQAIGL